MLVYQRVILVFYRMIFGQLSRHKLIEEMGRCALEKNPRICVWPNEVKVVRTFQTGNAFLWTWAQSDSIRVWLVSTLLQKHLGAPYQTNRYSYKFYK
jgi:hypothetical protein